jgi:membrane protease YdiL (CAAX protease family)
MIDSKLPASTLESPTTRARLTWLPRLAVGTIMLVALIFFGSQFVGSLVVLIYPTLRHWTDVQASDWLQASIIAQFVFVLAAEAFTMGAIYLYLRKQRARLSSIGWLRPRWRDVGYAAIIAIAYFAVYITATALISQLIPSLNVSQKQQIGFNNVHGSVSLLLAFISLVILPPLAEEIMFRGFLYSNLKKAMPKLAAVLLTSAIFAGAHLPEGGAAGPLYIAAIDTFILSLFLIYLREKTGSLWASITLHAIKNGVAFVALFLLHVH